MARIRQLDWYQRGILLLLLALALVFAVIYRVRIARVGFLYKENHRQCRWFQKALAMHRKNVLV